MNSRSRLTRRFAPGIRSAAAFLLPILLVIVASALASPNRERRSAGSDEPILSGQWTVDASPKSDRLQFGLRTVWEDGHSSWSRSVTVDRLDGLAPEVLGREAGDVTFVVRRDAGSIRCNGSFAKGHGAGVFTIELDPEFARELERRGVGKVTPAQQAEMTFADVGLSLLDELKTAGYPTPDADELVNLANHGVNVEFVREFSAMGYKFGSLEKLRDARDHGVTPAYVKALEKEGFGKLDYEELQRARDHGVDASYIAAMRRAGATDATLAEFVELRDHGVSADYVEAMREAGFQRATLDELRMARDHGVDERFVLSLEAAGFKGLPLRSVVNARDHGVSGKIARRGREELGAKATIDDVIDWHDRGGR